jgi:DNA repair exonuclease SbcCD ATPase subunit
MTTPLPDITQDTLLQEVRTQRELLNRLLEKLGLDAPPAATSSEPSLVEDASASAPPPQETALEKAKADLEMALADIRLEHEKARRELETTLEQSKHAEAELLQRQQAVEAAKSARTEAESELAAVRAEIVKLKETLQQIEARRQELETAAAEAEGVIEQAEAISRDKADLETKLAALAAQETEYRGYREDYEATQRVLTRIWPEWLRDGALASWREQIEIAQFQAEAPASATLLFAALHGYRAALRETTDSRVLLDAIREVARRLYQWLKDQGKTENEAAEIAQSWAAGINRECDGKAEVEVPIPGDPADSTWMSFRPGASAMPVVVSVQTWCVRDSLKRPLNKAQITA